MNTERMLIIGSGQAGLAAAYHARRSGVEPVILEASDAAGGSWPAYYNSLRLFSPARFSSLPGLPFPGDSERYPTRDEVEAYLADYTTWLAPDIRYRSSVSAVNHSSTGFIAETSDGTVHRAQALIATSGSFGTPYRPQLRGLESFAGKVLHSSEYVTAAGLSDARIVVVGAGNSAVQIAVELAETATVTLATRKPIRWVSQRPFNRDVHWWLTHSGFDRAPLGRWLARLAVGVLDHGAYRAAVHQGRPDRRPMFTKLEGDFVEWEDGTREHIDVLILATGFRPDLGYLAPTGALHADGAPRHRHGLSTTVAGLGYVGLEFQRTFASATLRGVGADARHVIRRISSETERGN